MKDAGAVGAELHPGTHLLQLGGLLVDVDIDAALEQREGGGEAADPRACDEDVQPPLLARCDASQ